ncbi:hypothetical protein GOBAR_AA21708 [Gossypium barbadense]|uniref:Saccharopine dehydrogenase NADP binding domain-containing protein n=1 Tax=Gossypium barbadense TaxID=3634 RepID=A0A2P5X6J8_GOSBA|nr:hypothetical protein GOBAR_AA21708 [Gossypium barbadense]
MTTGSFTRIFADIDLDDDNQDSVPIDCENEATEEVRTNVSSSDTSKHKTPHLYEEVMSMEVEGFDDDFLCSVFDYLVSHESEAKAFLVKIMAPSLLYFNTAAAVAVASAKAAENDNVSRVQLLDKTRNSRVLVLGGTGRVGGSTATALSKLCPDLRIVVGGRNREKGAAMVATLGKNSEFAEVNINNKDSLEAALSDVDLVVHAAGPFQQSQKCTVLEAAIETQTAYLDVCDDTNYAFRAKSFKGRAVDANIPAITTGGVYPGVSNVMAAELVRAARSESKTEPERLR